MTAMSSVSAVTTALPGAALGAYPSFGMAMRFWVTVDGLSIGQWSSCKGLNVKLGFRKIEQGGEYTRRTLVPEHLEYQPITLERAVSHSDSTALQLWLTEYVKEWDLYPKRPAGIRRTSATVQLLDHQMSPVMRWELTDVFPSAWTGPSLAAGDNKVALESLVLEHEGFLAIEGKHD